MTQSVETNPYGVRVPGDGSGLWWATEPLDDHPLVAWEEDSHARAWVDVDHAEEQVRKFEASLARLPEMILPQVDRGHVVVVTGPVGMGKTTLIHRCVHLMQERLREAAERAGHSRLGPDDIRPPRPVVVMTGGYRNHPDSVSVDERGRFATTEGINSAIRKKIVSELELRFTDAVKGRVPVDGSVLDTFAEISRLLAEQDAMLLALVPHLGWRDDMGSVRTEFLRSCLRHARSRIVLFVEVGHHDPHTAHDEVIAVLGSQPALTHLSLGSLSPEDTVKFSQAARGEHPDPDALPSTAPDAPRDPEAWRRSDVRELRKICFSVAEEQRRRHGRVRVTASDLPTPTPDLASLARVPPRAERAAVTAAAARPYGAATPAPLPVPPQPAPPPSPGA
ncbi:hypothetical protein ACFZDK_05915 [Streptomyces sp. NPDC007901]|uniref:hypothetical protein n=1 Tax=Streptomyces sp. NPDC007901 TaxID=3364785 RepID=UPI0036EA14F5